MSRSASTPTLHLISPPSVAGWFAYFTTLYPDDRVREIGEGPEVDLAPLVEALGEGLPGGTREVVMFSSHDALRRDLRLADELRARRVAVSAQSPGCARLGYDKFVMKEFFDRHGLPTAPWARGTDVSSLGPADAPVVVKHRRGTQNIGTYLTTVGRCELGPDEFAELYIDGIEYSVVVYRDQHGTATFPPVWKGRTTPELTPPWRRLRLCPDREGSPALDRSLREVAEQMVVAADGTGHAEVELVVDEAGGVHLLEINPRVSGTMRISAMATRLPIFSLYRLPEERGALSAVRYAAEVPYSGPPIYDPESATFGTSRLTVAADDPAEVRRKLEEACDRVGVSVGETR